MVNIQIIAPKPIEFENYCWKGEEFFKCCIKPKRKNGREDEILMLVTSSMKEKILNIEEDKIEVYAKIDTKSKLFEEGERHLDIVIIAEWIYPVEGDVADKNCVQICEGYICKKSPLRKTPRSGDSIQDVILAVNYENSSAYIPTVMWNKNADAVKGKKLGTRISLKGSLQSRKYYKKDENGVEESKTAYELSACCIKFAG